MYSPSSQIHVASQQFDPHHHAAVAANAGDCGLPSSTSSPFNLGTQVNTCFQSQDSYDYMRRFSYAELLSNQSEASLSDTEQQTPSPSNDYEEYVYLQQQHQPHPLEQQKQPFQQYAFMDSVCQQQQAIPSYHHDAMTAWFSNAQQSPMDLNGARSLIMNQELNNYCPTTLPTTALLDYHHHPLSPGYMMDASALTAAPTAVMPMEDASFRERASSSSSCSTHPPSSEAAEEQQEKPEMTKTTKKNKVKQTRSRGRRVSSHPGAIGQKMFTCRHDDCGKVFKRSEHLKRHIRSIHTLEKPFECPYHSCSKRFSRSDNLNQHIRIHRHTNKDKSTTKNSNSSANNTSSSSPSSSASSSPVHPTNSTFSNYMQNFL